MAENANVFDVVNVYVKDVSFESPKAPGIFSDKSAESPAMSLNLDIDVQELGEDRFEVALTVTVTAKLEEETLFITEANQAAIVILKGFNDEQKGQLLNAVTPSMLFPYARETISNIIVKGGFPALFLKPVNFDLLYQQSLKQESAEAE